jgi:hypothetical protein
MSTGTQVFPSLPPNPHDIEDESCLSEVRATRAELQLLTLFACLHLLCVVAVPTHLLCQRRSHSTMLAVGGRGRLRIYDSLGGCGGSLSYLVQ